MDSSSVNLGGGDSAMSFDASRLSEHDKRELQEFVRNEAQKASIQESIHQLTAMCFKKCVTARISGAQLDRSEEPCVQNCVARFMDSNMLTLRHLERMRNQGGAVGN